MKPSTLNPLTWKWRRLPTYLMACLDALWRPSILWILIFVPAVFVGGFAWMFNALRETFKFEESLLATPQEIVPKVFGVRQVEIKRVFVEQWGSLGLLGEIEKSLEEGGQGAETAEAELRAVDALVTAIVMEDERIVNQMLAFIRASPSVQAVCSQVCKRTLTTHYLGGLLSAHDLLIGPHSDLLMHTSDAFWLLSRARQITDCLRPANTAADQSIEWSRLMEKTGDDIYCPHTFSMKEAAISKSDIKCRKPATSKREKVFAGLYGLSQRLEPRTWDELHGGRTYAQKESMRLFNSTLRDGQATARDLGQTWRYAFLAQKFDARLPYHLAYRAGRKEWAFNEAGHPLRAGSGERLVCALAPSLEEEVSVEMDGKTMTTTQVLERTGGSEDGNAEVMATPEEYEMGEDFNGFNAMDRLR